MAKKIHAKNLLKEAVACSESERRVAGDVAMQRRISLVARKARRDGERLVVASTAGEIRNRVLVLQNSADPSEAKVSRADAPQGQCENLVCALKVLANFHVGADKNWWALQGLEQVRLRVTNESRKFIAVDNHEAVKIGDLEKNSEASKEVRPTSN